MNEACEADTTKLSLSGELTIYFAHELKNLLLTALDENCDVDIDVAEVSEVDTAGLQLVLLAQKELESKGHRLRLLNANPEILKTLALYRL